MKSEVRESVAVVGGNRRPTHRTVSGAAAGGLVALAMSWPAPALAQYDHLQCFKVTDGQKFGAAVVNLAPLQNPPFAPEPGCVIKGKAKELCIPVSKVVVETDADQLPVDGIEQPQAFVCYTVKCPQAAAADIAMSDQFGARTFTKLKSKKVCVPAVEGILTTTTTTLPPDELCNGATILSELSCSSDFSAELDPTQSSDLGGSCGAGLCYSCGLPVEDAEQTNAEDIYAFSCQNTGQVTLLLTNPECDLDIYVLDATCDPSSACVAGSTVVGIGDDSVVFNCSAGTTYYAVVEGTSGCTPGNAGYTIDVEAANGTGCPEDCDDGQDNDLDVDIDCADADCAADSACLP